MSASASSPVSPRKPAAAPPVALHKQAPQAAPALQVELVRSDNSGTLVARTFRVKYKGYPYDMTVRGKVYEDLTGTTEEQVTKAMEALRGKLLHELTIAAAPTIRFHFAENKGFLAYAPRDGADLAAIESHWENEAELRKYCAQYERKVDPHAQKLANAFLAPNGKTLVETMTKWDTPEPAPAAAPAPQPAAPAPQPAAAAPQKQSTPPATPKAAPPPALSLVSSPNGSEEEEEEAGSATPISASPAESSASEQSAKLLDLEIGDKLTLHIQTKKGAQPGSKKAWPEGILTGKTGEVEIDLRQYNVSIDQVKRMIIQCYNSGKVENLQLIVAPGFESENLFKWIEKETSSMSSSPKWASPVKGGVIRLAKELGNGARFILEGSAPFTTVTEDQKAAKWAKFIEDLKKEECRHVFYDAKTLRQALDHLQKEGIRPNQIIHIGCPNWSLNGGISAIEGMIAQIPLAK